MASVLPNIVENV